MHISTIVVTDVSWKCNGVEVFFLAVKWSEVKVATTTNTWVKYRNVESVLKYST